MTTLFIADLHLDAAQPDTTALFLQFLHEQARGAQALYILGDLFEAWVGDDDPAPVAAAVADALHGLSEDGTTLCFIHGNRDFLLGHDYARRCGMRILPDPSIILLEGEPVLIGHGDLLCTDDVAYQQFRTQTRDPAWQAQFLSQPLPARLAFAQQARAASKAHQGELRSAGRMETITDVSADTVARTFARYGVKRMIHGHTHRPAIHDDADGSQRIVLGDWYGRHGACLRVRQGQWMAQSVEAVLDGNRPR